MTIEDSDKTMVKFFEILKKTSLFNQTITNLITTFGKRASSYLSLPLFIKNNTRRRRCSACLLKFQKNQAYFSNKSGAGSLCPLCLVLGILEIQKNIQENTKKILEIITK